MWKRSIVLWTFHENGNDLLFSVFTLTSGRIQTDVIIARTAVCRHKAEMRLELLTRPRTVTWSQRMATMVTGIVNHMELTLVSFARARNLWFDPAFRLNSRLANVSYYSTIGPTTRDSFGKRSSPTIDSVRDQIQVRLGRVS